MKELFQRALALHQAGRLAEAEGLYRRILATDARALGPRQMLGVALAQQGRHDEALAALAAALAVNPRDVGALVNYGNIQTLAGRHAEAVESFDRALALDGRAIEAWSNRGNALAALGRHGEALESFDRALALKPDYVDAAFNRGNALLALNRVPEALAAFERVVTLAPGHAQAWFKRGAALQELDRADDAFACYDRVLTLQPGNAEALNNRGHLWWSARRDYAKALADLEAARQADAAMPWLAGAIFHLKAEVCDWSGFDAGRDALIDGVRAGRRVARPFMFQAVSDQPADLQACSRLFAADRFPGVTAAPVARLPQDRIRVGYLSGEFREQATAILMAGVYELHDRARFEITAIDNGPDDGSPMRRRLEKAFDHWLDIRALDDDQAAAAIRARGIDILVNLNGWFGRPRMGVFARRAAPVQVNYLGFPATLGAPYIDNIIADATVIPEGEERFYDERVIRLPDCYQANDNRGRAIAPPPGRAEAGLPPDGFVFCNFNHSYKLTPRTFESWMRILAAVPDSVLWLLEGPAPLAENLRREAQARGVAGSRIVFAPHRPPPEHLARLQLAGLFLDSLPYNAHTTASDALWAGVPLLTLRGHAFPGRVAASLLTAADLPDLIVESAQDYEALAIRLAYAPRALAALRERLAANRDSCALFDTDRFRRALEAAYESMLR